MSRMLQACTSGVTQQGASARSHPAEGATNPAPLTLVRHVVQHEHGAGKVELAVVAVVGLRACLGAACELGGENGMRARPPPAFRVMRAPHHACPGENALHSWATPSASPGGRRAAGWCASRWPQTQGCPAGEGGAER